MWSSSKVAIKKFKRIRNKFCDTTIKTNDGSVFKVHKYLLALHSQFFSKLFKFHSQKEYFLSFLPSKIKGLKNIFHWIYEQTLELGDIEDEFDLLAAADYLLCPEVFQMALSALKNHITDENVILALFFSKAYNFQELEQFCWKYIEFNFNGVSQSEDFTQLSFEDLRRFLNSDTLNIREVDLCKSVNKWIEFEPYSRQQHSKDLFECLRHGELYEDLCQYYPQLTQDESNTNDFISGDWHMNPITLYYLAKNVFTDTPLDFQMNETIPRCWSNSLLISGGWISDAESGLNGPCNIMEAFDMRQNIWHQLDLFDPLGSRCYISMIFFPPKFVYFIGGTRNNQHRNEVNRLDVLAQKFANVAPMLNRRCFLSTALVNGKIFAIGGHDGTRRLRSVEVYDPERDEWNFVQSLNEVRSDAGATSLNSKVYVAGGFNGNTILSSVECYDSDLDEWTFLPHLTTPRSGAQLVAAQGALYCMGGYNGSERLSTCERFSFETRQWEIIPNMNSARSNFSSSVIEDRIIVCGGFREPQPISTVESFDIRQNKWTILAQLNKPRSALAAVFIPGLNIIYPEFGPPPKPDLPAEAIQSHFHEFYDDTVETFDIERLFEEMF